MLFGGNQRLVALNYRQNRIWTNYYDNK